MPGDTYILEDAGRCIWHRSCILRVAPVLAYHYTDMDVLLDIRKDWGDCKVLVCVNKICEWNRVETWLSIHRRMIRGLSIHYPYKDDTRMIRKRSEPSLGFLEIFCVGRCRPHSLTFSSAEQVSVLLVITTGSVARSALSPQSSRTLWDGREREAGKNDWKW